MLGLMLIALGTGGIKPCVSAFGGDQFGPHQVYWLMIVVIMQAVETLFCSNLNSSFNLFIIFKNCINVLMFV